MVGNCRCLVQCRTTTSKTRRQGSGCYRNDVNIDLRWGGVGNVAEVIRGLGYMRCKRAKAYVGGAPSRAQLANLPMSWAVVRYSLRHQLTYVRHIEGPEGSV